MLTCCVTWTGKWLKVRSPVDGVTGCTLEKVARICGCTLGGAGCPLRTIWCNRGRVGRVGGYTLGSDAGTVGVAIGAGRWGGITCTSGGCIEGAGAGGLRCFGGFVAR